MKKRSFITAISALIILFSLTGCVRVVQIGHEGDITGNKTFNSDQTVESFWQTKALPELTKKAVNLSQLLAESHNDLTSQKEKYGQNDKAIYVVKGQGTITTVDTKNKAGYLVLKLDDYNGPATIELQIGSVYKGSAVRDSLSFIKYEDYKNQVAWAKIAQSIHTVIDKTVIKKQNITELTGKTISFVGCFSANTPKEILITPVELTVK